MPSCDASDPFLAFLLRPPLVAAAALVMSAQAPSEPPLGPGQHEQQEQSMAQTLQYFLTFSFLGSNPYRAWRRKQQPVPTYTGPWIPSSPGMLIWYQERGEGKGGGG